MATQVEIKRHPRLPETHARVIVTTGRGLCYFTDWANASDDQPITQSQATKAWKEDRKSFAPYYGH
jgi:hypothetical protein